MLFNTPVAVVLFAGSAFAAAEPAPYKLGSRSANPAYGLMKRQNGYQPQEVRCGPGADCAASCGAAYIQCASTDGDMHCYDPSIRKEKCCPDGTGNSCRNGFFCTSDTAGSTWCCPDGMDLVTCAKRYDLTDSLVSQIATATPTGHGNATVTDTTVTTPVVNSTYTTSYHNNTYTSSYHNNTYTITTCTKSCHATQTPTNSPTTVTTAPPVQFTGAANAHTVGLPAFVLAVAGAVFAL